MNRLPPSDHPEAGSPPQKTDSFFLACEFKPGGAHWGVVEPFAYDLRPAFMYGSLGILGYDPMSYAVVEEGKGCQPLMGYLMTITCPDMVQLLDRLKGIMGEGGFSLHARRQIEAFADVGKPQPAWCYMISGPVLNAYQSIETVEFGMTTKDERQTRLLNKILGRAK